MIIKPLITEKTIQQTAENRYTFVVTKNSTKGQIKEEVEKLFKVDVVAVRTSNFKSETKRSMRTGRKLTKKGFKKAVVELKPKQSIKYFETK